MAIEIIPNQPINFSSVNDVTDTCCTKPTQCALVQDGDDLYVQLKMLACGDELICGQIALGPELVLNGDFADGSDNWTVSHGDNWTFTDNKACISGVADTLTQAIAGLAEGNTYRLTFTITDYVSGNLLPTLWDTNGTNVNADGNYTQDITIAPGHVNETLVFTVDGSWDGCISNIHLGQFPDCWTESDATEGTVTTIDQDGLCVSGSVAYTSTVTGASTVTPRYVVSFTIFNYVSGTIGVRFGSGGITHEGYSGNGEKFAYDFFLTDTSLSFIFDNFVGCISDISIKLLQPPVFYAVNLDNGVIVNLGTIYNSYYRDRVTFQLTLEGENVLSYGCWKLCFINECGTQGNELLRNGTFTDDLDGWIAGSGWYWDNDKAHYLNSGVSGLLYTVLESEAMMCVSVEVYKVIGELRFNLIHGSDLVDTITITEPGVYTLCGLATRIQFNALGGTTNGVDNEYLIDNVSAFTITDCDECAAYCSNCFRYAASFDCTKLISGYSTDDSFRFIFYDNSNNLIFKLQQRVRCELLHSKYPQDQKDFIFSSGNTAITFAQSEAYRTLHIVPIPTYKHDCMALIKLCDTFSIDGVNYFAKKADYSPEWNTDSNADLAPVQFDVKKKADTFFNSACE